MRATQPGYRRLLGKGFPSTGVFLGHGTGPGHPVRLQGVPSRGGAGPLWPPTCNEHRLRRRADLSRPPAQLPNGHRAHSLVRQARLPNASWASPGSSVSPGICSGSHSSIAESSGILLNRCDGSRLHRPAGAHHTADHRRAVVRGRCRSDGCRRRGALGYDFLAYHQAVERVTNDGRLYDMSFTETGGFGLFYYPPTFAPLLLPLSLLPAEPAIWIWIGVSLAAFLVGTASVPVSRSSVRWWILLLAGLSFPFVYAVKLGQVGPILFLLFAVGWRGHRRPFAFGRQRRARGSHQAPAGAGFRLGAPDATVPGGGRGDRRARRPQCGCHHPRRSDRMVRLPLAPPDS